mgnify:CR=1 FL=1
MPERLENFKSPFWFDKDDIKSIGDVIDKLESLSTNERNEIFEDYRKLYLEKMSQSLSIRFCNYLCFYINNKIKTPK